MNSVSNFDGYVSDFDLPAGVEEVDLMVDDLDFLLEDNDLNLGSDYATDETFKSLRSEMYEIAPKLILHEQTTSASASADNLSDDFLDDFEKDIGLDLNVDEDQLPLIEPLTPLGDDFTINGFKSKEDSKEFWDDFSKSKTNATAIKSTSDGFDFGFDGIKGQKEVLFDGNLNRVEENGKPVYQKANNSGRLGRATGSGSRSKPTPAHPWMWNNTGKMKIPNQSLESESEEETEEKAYKWFNTGKNPHGLGRGKNKTYIESLKAKSKLTIDLRKKVKGKATGKIVTVPDFANWTRSDREGQDWREYKTETDKVCGYYPIWSTRKLPIAMRKLVKDSKDFNYTLRKKPKYFPIPKGDYKCEEDSVKIGIYAPDRKNQCSVRFNADNRIHFIVDAKAVFFTAKFKITGNGKENFKNVFMTIDGKKCLPSWAIKKEGDYYTFIFVPTYSSGYVLGRGTSELETRRFHIEVFGKTWKVQKHIMVVIVNGTGIRKFFGDDQNPADNGSINLQNKQLYEKMYIDQLIN